MFYKKHVYTVNFFDSNRKADTKTVVAKDAEDAIANVKKLMPGNQPVEIISVRIQYFY